MFYIILFFVCLFILNKLTGLSLFNFFYLSYFFQCVISGISVIVWLIGFIITGAVPLAIFIGAIIYLLGK